MSVKEKARHGPRQVWTGKTNESEPLMKCRKVKVMSKPGGVHYPGISAEEICLLSARHPALRWRDSSSGSCMEPGNLSPGCKGRRPSGSPTRIRVPMPGTGAEWPVVVTKARNGAGAKGPCHPCFDEWSTRETGRSRT